MQLHITYSQDLDQIQKHSSWINNQEQGIIYRCESAKEAVSSTEFVDPERRGQTSPGESPFVLSGITFDRAAEECRQVTLLKKINQQHNTYLT